MLKSLIIFNLFIFSFASLGANEEYYLPMVTPDRQELSITCAPSTSEAYCSVGMSCLTLTVPASESGDRPEEVIRLTHYASGCEQAAASIREQIENTARRKRDDFGLVISYDDRNRKISSVTVDEENHWAQFGANSQIVNCRWNMETDGRPKPRYLDPDVMLRFEVCDNNELQFQEVLCEDRMGVTSIRQVVCPLAVRKAMECYRGMVSAESPSRPQEATQ